MPPHTYPSISAYPILLFPYNTSTTMYAPYLVQHYPHIPSLGDLYRPPSIITYPMLPNLFPPEAPSHLSANMNWHRRNRINLISNESKSIRLVPAQDGPIFYKCSHLSALQSCALPFSINFQFIFLFKKCITQFSHWIVFRLIFSKTSFFTVIY